MNEKVVVMGHNANRNVLFLSFTALTAVLFYHVFAELVNASFHNELYSHIILIPFVSAFLIFLDRKEIFSETRYDLFPGLAIISCGIIIKVLAGRAGLNQENLMSVMVFSVLLLWVGGCTLFYGLKALRKASFPLMFLLFMVPIPTPLSEGLIAALQKGSAEVSNWVFSLTGVPYIRDGYLFHFPSLSVEVAEECSGIRSSLALFITSILAGHLFLRTGWKKAVLAVSIFPITVFKNGLRIVTLSLLGVYIDPAFLSSSLHRRGGIPFFILALLLWMPILWLLRKSEKGRPSDVEVRR